MAEYRKTEKYNIYIKDYIAKNKEKRTIYMREYRKTEKHKEYIKQYRNTTKYKQAQRKREQKRDRRAMELKYKYGITVDEYNILLEAQSGKCAICKTNSPGGKFNNFHVDHDHNTNKIRGLLCMNCNTALGSLKEDINIIEAMLHYITERQV